MSIEVTGIGAIEFTNRTAYWEELTINFCINCCFISSLCARTKLSDNHTSLGDHERISGHLITLTMIPVMRRLSPLTVKI